LAYALPFRKHGERTIHEGPLISVVAGTFAAPSGQEFERDLVRHPGAVSVVPILRAGEVVMVRQYRAAVDTELLEIPAGKRDVAGEPPEDTARRELIEEIGMRPGRLELLAEFYNSPGFCDERSFVFLARDLEVVGSPDPQGPEEHAMSIERVALADVPGMIQTGAIVDAKSIIGLTLARERLR
jgi:ADP-ribose pyrophosphatase